MKTLTESAKIYHACGALLEQGVTVIDEGDTIRLNKDKYPKRDLDIEPNKITGISGWFVQWDQATQTQGTTCSSS